MSTLFFSATGRRSLALSLALISFVVALLASCSTGSLSDHDVKTAFAACTAGIQAAASGSSVTTTPVAGETEVTQTSADGKVVITIKDFPSSSQTYWSIAFSNYTDSGYTISGALSGNVSGYGSASEVISQAGILSMKGGPVTSLGFSTQSSGPGSGPFTYTGDVVANGTKTVAVP